MLAQPPGAEVDLCSASWAVGNAYLICSGVLALWLHFLAMRMVKGAAFSGLLGAENFFGPPPPLLGAFEAAWTTSWQGGGGGALAGPGGGWQSWGPAGRATVVPMGGFDAPQQQDMQRDELRTHGGPRGAQRGQSQGQSHSGGGGGGDGGWPDDGDRAFVAFRGRPHKLDGS